MFQFGAGTLWATPYGSNAAANPTPVQFGTIQDVSLEISGTVKELYGKKQFPVAIARSQVKITGKAKFASINGKLFNDLFFGNTVETGPVLAATDEKGTPATNAITVTKSANFVDDLGVRYASTGLPLEKVAATPAEGQYSVAAGVYTFNASDVGDMLISYTYGQGASPVGSKIVVKNQDMGKQPNFTIHLNQAYDGKQVTFKLLCCVASKLGLATKNEDFSIPEFDFQAFADASGDVMEIHTGE